MKYTLVKFPNGEFGIKRKTLFSTKWFDFADKEFASTSAPYTRVYMRTTESHARSHFEFITSGVEVVETR